MRTNWQKWWMFVCVSVCVAAFLFAGVWYFADDPAVKKPTSTEHWNFLDWQSSFRTWQDDLDCKHSLEGTIIIARPPADTSIIIKNDVMWCNMIYYKPLICCGLSWWYSGLNHLLYRHTADQMGKMSFAHGNMGYGRWKNWNHVWTISSTTLDLKWH